MRSTVLILLLVLSAFWTATSWGIVITVKADGSGDQPNIQAAVMAAVPGDSVCLVDPLYVGVGNLDISFLGKAITIYSPSGDPDLCVIDCMNLDFSEDRLGFLFISGEDSTSVLHGVTIYDAFSAYSSFGAAIHCESSSPTISNCKITGVQGGIPVFLDSSSPIISNTTVANNDGSGTETGAIQCTTNSSPRITDCDIYGNFGPDCAEKLTGCQGGGIKCIGNSNPLIIRCNINTNGVLNASGAGIGCLDSSPTLVDCVISYNQVGHVAAPEEFGTGLDLVNSSSLVEGCLFIGNGASPTSGRSAYGGGIAVRDGSHLILNGCTVVGNVAALGGGGIYVSESDLTASNTIIAFNDLEAIFTDLPGVISLTCCNIYGNTGGDWTGAIAGQLGINGNISADPQFCDVGTDDLTLRSDSPCLGHNHPDGPACGQIGALGLGCFTVAPWITSVTDVGNDQGRLVRLSWNRSDYDAIGSPNPITEYGIYRRQVGFAASDQSSLNQDKLAGWDFLGPVQVRGDEVYQFTAPTLCDSTVAGGVCWTTFMVTAMTAQHLVFYDSPPDSGYSLDNLAPGVPVDIQAGYGFDGVTLDWDVAPDLDFQYFAIYRDTDPNFIPSPATLVHQTATPDWTDPTADPWHYYYKITALDHAGNESDPGVPGTVSAARNETVPGKTGLLGAVPNPFNPTTMLSFTMAAEGHARVAVYDVAGRLVVTVVDEHRSAGRHEVMWDGRDSAGRMSAAGVFLYRLEAGGIVQTRRMLMVK